MTCYDTKTKKLFDYGFRHPITGEEVKNMTKRIVEKTIKLEEGKHYGEVENIEYKTEPFKYVDIHVKEKETGFVLKCGVPDVVTENSALGHVLVNFGAKLKEGEGVEIEDFIKEGLKVSFITINEQTKKGVFVKIQPMTLKPEA